MIKTKHDTACYDKCGYKREIYNPTVLYEAWLKARQSSGWKQQVQKFEVNLLSELSTLSRELQAESYSFKPRSEFTIHERGKTRAITGEQIQDRVVKRALCDNFLLPAILPRLIYDNGAGIKGKGVDFARRRIITHLQRFYRQNGSNEGYILLIDFKKFYDNIRHDVLLDLLRQLITNDHALWLLEKSLEASKVDISYLPEEPVIFDALKHRQTPQKLLTGDRFMRRHLNLGDHISQVASVFYVSPLDNYIKIVRGIKFYGRYMDDSYIIYRDKDFLKALLQEIKREADKLGIIIHDKKTRICKLSDRWRFLQVQYCLTDTGRIIRKINPKRLTGMRRRMKKLVGVMPAREFAEYFRSWFNGYYKLMSNKQKETMNDLYFDLCRRQNA